MRSGSNDRYQVTHSKADLRTTMQLHEAKVMEWEPLHGKPNRSSSAEEYLDAMNQFVVAHGHQQIARSTTNMFRIAAYMLSGLYLFITCLNLVPYLRPGSPPSLTTFLGTIGITSVIFLLIIGGALILQHKIQHDFLNEPQRH